MEQITIKSLETVVVKRVSIEFLECDYLDVHKRLIAYKDGNGIVKLFRYQDFFDWILPPKKNDAKNWKIDESQYEDYDHLSLFLKRILFKRCEYDTIQVFLKKPINELESQYQDTGGFVRWVESFDDTRITLLGDQRAIITSKLKMSNVIQILENECLITKFEYMDNLSMK